MGIRQVRKSLATATSESMSSKWFNGGGLSLLVKAEGIHSKCFQFVFPDECELVVWSLERGFVLDQLVILKRFTALSDLNQFMLEVSAYFLK